MSPCSPHVQNSLKTRYSAQTNIAVGKRQVFKQMITHFWYSSRTALYFLLLMKSPICFLSSFGFSLMNLTTSFGSRGEDSSSCSCRYVIPRSGFKLNCSVPVWYIYNDMRNTIINGIINNVQRHKRIQYVLLVWTSCRDMTKWSVNNHVASCWHISRWPNFRLI